MQRVMAIIQKLVSEILHNDKESIDGPQLVKMLISEGYDSDEIEQALSLVFPCPILCRLELKTLDTQLGRTQCGYLHQRNASSWIWRPRTIY